MAARVIIVGGGFNGRLLQTLVPGSRVFDWRDTRPEKDARMFGPQYLWEPLPGFECRSFPVTTLVDGKPATDASVLAYKRKVSKDLDGGDWRAQFKHRTTGYDLVLPPDTVEYGRKILAIDPYRRRIQLTSGPAVPYDFIMSTIPLFALINMIPKKYEGLAKQFAFKPIYFRTLPMRAPWLTVEMWLSGMRVNYVSDPDAADYRVTYRDRLAYHETLLPCTGATRFVPGKIYESGHAAWVTNSLTEYGIHCFGRFASWAPDELAHETFTRARGWAIAKGLTR